MRYLIVIVSLVIVAIVVSFSIPVVFGQFVADIMITDLRSTHNTLEKNIDQVITLLKNNHTAEALNLLDGMKIKIHHMNLMFDDLVWELSNRGH